MKELINDLITNYLVYILIILFAVSLGVGLLGNLKKLRSDDKNVKDEGIEGLLYTTFGFFIVIFLLGVIFAKLTGALTSWSV